MRQRNAEMPGEEKVRIASFSVTFGFKVRMAGVIMIDLRQSASAEVDPQADHRGDQHPREHEVDQVFRGRFSLEMGCTHIGSVKLVAHGSKSQSRDLFP